MTSLRLAAVYLAGGLVGGFALSALLSDEPAPANAPASAPTAGASLEQRMVAIERRLDAVIAANAALGGEIERIGGLIEASDALAAERRAVTPRSESAGNATSGENADGESDSATGPGFERPRRSRQRDLAEQLTAGGFSEGDARRIETRVEELRVAAMQSRYEAVRSGEPPGGAREIDATAALRTELGDAQYERFLEATGRPTRVGVASVLASSAAETAGILSGDEILAYGGERVFDLRDLNRVLLDGEPGQPVVVDIVREGQPMQIVMPRGPLGISSGFRRRGGG